MLGFWQILLIIGLLGVLALPLGNYLAFIYTSTRHWRLEKFCYRFGRRFSQEIRDPGFPDGPTSPSWDSITANWDETLG